MKHRFHVVSFWEGHISYLLRTVEHAEPTVIITLETKPCPHKQFRTFSVFEWGYSPNLHEMWS